MGRSALWLALLAAWLLIPGEAGAVPLIGSPEIATGLPVLSVKFGCTFMNRKLVCGDLNEILKGKKGKNAEPQANPADADQGGGGVGEAPGDVNGGGGVGQAPDAGNAGAGADADVGAAEETNPDEHPCTVGTVVLKTPNAAGSFCEPVPGKIQGREVISCPAGYIVLGTANPSKYGAFCEEMKATEPVPVQDGAQMLKKNN